MLIKLHGQFAKDYGPEHVIYADSVAEAIDGWSRQVDFYGDRLLEDKPIVRILDCNSEDDLFGKTEQKEIHLVPAMIGGGGNFGKILLGGALIGLSFLVPGSGAIIGSLTWAGVGSGLMAAGIGMVLTGVMGFFIKAPTVSKDGDPEASKYLGLGDNTVTIGTPISIDYGRGPKSGHVLAVNVDSSDMIHGTFPAVPI